MIKCHRDSYKAIPFKRVVGCRLWESARRDFKQVRFKRQRTRQLLGQHLVVMHRILVSDLGSYCVIKPLLLNRVRPTIKSFIINRTLMSVQNIYAFVRRYTGSQYRWYLYPNEIDCSDTTMSSYTSSNSKIATSQQKVNQFLLIGNDLAQWIMRLQVNQHQAVSVRDRSQLSLLFCLHRQSKEIHT